MLALVPVPGKAKIALPAGNKYGEFSFSPVGKNFGSPGGSGTVAIAGGSDGISAGGDGSTGVGNGKDGGGGKDGSGAMVSLNGIGAAGGDYQMMIFPVPPTPKIRKNNLLISAGPMGGGGLGVYKALPCGSSLPHSCRCLLQTGQWSTARPASIPLHQLAPAALLFTWRKR